MLVMRNNNSSEIKKIINEGYTPVLRFEERVLRAELGRLGLEQDGLSRLLGEAMEQSSETWHDNAPADAVNYQSKLLAGQAETIIGDLKRAVAVDYPRQGTETATLGSIVSVTYGRDYEVSDMLIAGLCRKLPKLTEKAPFGDEVEVATIRSPLGAAVLGLAMGDSVTYDANGRKITVVVSKVQQVMPHYFEAES